MEGWRDIMLSEMRLSEVRLSEVRLSEVRLSEVRLSDISLLKHFLSLSPPTHVNQEASRRR